MKKNKTVKILAGTDIPFCAPCHPLSVVVQTKRVIDRIVNSTDSEFEFSCNTPEGIEMWQRYGHEVCGLTILLSLNGEKTTYDDVMADLTERAKKFIQETLNTEKQ